jgi:glycerol kinase
VEQEPADVSAGVAAAITEAITQAGCHPSEIAACGLAGQRNTDFVWDKQIGQPLGRAITWQDLRTLPLLAELANQPLAQRYRQHLGYLPGPYSSALHLAWRLRHEPEVIAAARSGRLAVGYSTNWLLLALGQPAGHMLDYALLHSLGVYDLWRERYWEEWLTALGIPTDCLPEAAPSVHSYGTLQISDAAGAVAEVPVLAMVGNEQAALFGHGCYQAGQTECSHGTVSFIDVCLGQTLPESSRLNLYYAWTLPARLLKEASPTVPPVHSYCHEADTTVSGAVIRWMREQARLFDHDHEVGPLAASVPDSAGVVFVPAFTGLNTPYHDVTARGTLFGLTLGSSRAHIVRAFVESLGFQVRAILDSLKIELGLHIDQLSVGGGIAASDEACQIQADMLGLPLVRPAFTEMAARAAALLAGLGAGTWPTLADLPPLPGAPTLFEPHSSQDQREAAYARWQRAVARAKGWSQEV